MKARFYLAAFLFGVCGGLVGTVNAEYMGAGGLDGIVETFSSGGGTMTGNINMDENYLYFDADGDTGIYSPLDDNMRFSAAGATYLDIGLGVAVISSQDHVFSREVVFESQTLAADATTFNTNAGPTIFTQANTGATNITSFTNLDQAGSRMVLCGGSDTNASVLVDSASGQSGAIRLASDANFTLGENDCIELMAISTTELIELYRVTN